MADKQQEVIFYHEGFFSSRTKARAHHEVIKKYCPEGRKLVGFFEFLENMNTPPIFKPPKLINRDPEEPKHWVRVQRVCDYFKGQVTIGDSCKLPDNSPELWQAAHTLRGWFYECQRYYPDPKEARCDQCGELLAENTESMQRPHNFNKLLVLDRLSVMHFQCAGDLAGLFRADWYSQVFQHHERIEYQRTELAGGNPNMKYIGNKPRELIYAQDDLAVPVAFPHVTRLGEEPEFVPCVSHFVDGRPPKCAQVIRDVELLEKEYRLESSRRVLRATPREFNKVEPDPCLTCLSDGLTGNELLFLAKQGSVLIYVYPYRSTLVKSAMSVAAAVIPEEPLFADAVISSSTTEQ
jgi:hypothetical protein